MGGSIRVNGDNVGDGVVDVGVAEGRVAALGGHRALAVQAVFQQRVHTLSRARRPRRRVAHLGRAGGASGVANDTRGVGHARRRRHRAGAGTLSNDECPCMW